MLEAITYLTTISVDLGFLWDFEVLKLKICSLYHEKLFIQKFNDTITQVLNRFFQPLTPMRNMGPLIICTRCTAYKGAPYWVPKNIKNLLLEFRVMLSNNLV